MLSWREAIRRQLIADLYAKVFVPEEKSPTFQVLQELSLNGGVSRAFVTYEAADGTTIPAYLFRPRINQRAPAVLVVPGHGRGIVETAGVVNSYQNGVALALAQAGFVTLTPELRGFGHLGEVLGTDHSRVALRALMYGTSYSAILLHDLRQGLTALMEHSTVDPARVAVTGCSLGGDLSVTLGALDTRVQAVIAQGLCRWHGDRGQRPTPEEDGSALARDPCGVIPGEGRLTHYEDRYLLLAPRPFAVINGRRDVGDIREEESWLLALLRGAYRLEGASDRFSFCLTGGGHEYHLQPAIAFLRHHLGGVHQAVEGALAPTESVSRVGYA
jgi:dienelactone hydrolase